MDIFEIMDFDHVRRGDRPDYQEPVSDPRFTRIPSSSYSPLSTDLSDQAEKGEFTKHGQDREVPPPLQSQPPFLDSTRVTQHDTTNTDPTETPQTDGGFILPAANAYSSQYPIHHETSHTPPFPPHYATPPSGKMARPQSDGRFGTGPAVSSSSVRGRYAPYRLPRPSPASPHPRTIAESQPLAPIDYLSSLPNSSGPKPHAMGASSAPVREPPAWRLDYKIGNGACGTVFLENVHIPGMKSPELWAVKRIPRALPNFTFKRYQAEIKNLQALSRHEWFVKFNSTYEDTHYMYIAMEYIPMGDMSQSLADGCLWNESDTKVVIKQLLHGLVVMHKEDITHRDLKPENIFLYLPENQSHVLHVKIGDFGTSKRIPPSNASTYLKTTTGTQGYMAPEMHDTSQPKTNKVDIWSLGCVLYRMFAGKLLFNDPFEVLKYALSASSSPLALDTIGFSIHCVSFLRDILQPNPEYRPSAEDCQKKAWITNEVPAREYSIGKDLYTRLYKINREAPNVHSFPRIAANRARENSPKLQYCSQFDSL